MKLHWKENDIKYQENMMTECKNATYGMMPELNQRIFEAKKNIWIHKTATKKSLRRRYYTTREVEKICQKEIKQTTNYARNDEKIYVFFFKEFSSKSQLKELVDDACKKRKVGDDAVQEWNPGEDLVKERNQESKKSKELQQGNPRNCNKKIDQ